MSLADIVIVLAVVIAFALCVRSLVRGQKAGECADCAMGGSCSAHETGHCRETEHLMASAAAAAKRHAEGQHQG